MKEKKINLIERELFPSKGFVWGHQLCTLYKNYTDNDKNMNSSRLKMQRLKKKNYREEQCKQVSSGGICFYKPA